MTRLSSFARIEKLEEKNVEMRSVIWNHMEAVEANKAEIKRNEEVIKKLWKVSQVESEFIPDKYKA